MIITVTALSLLGLVVLYMISKILSSMILFTFFITLGKILSSFDYVLSHSRIAAYSYWLIDTHEPVRISCYSCLSLGLQDHSNNAFQESWISLETSWLGKGKTKALMPARRGSWLPGQDFIRFWQHVSLYLQRHRNQDATESMDMGLHLDQDCVVLYISISLFKSKCHVMTLKMGWVSHWTLFFSPQYGHNE